MKFVTCTFSRCIATLLVCAMVTASVPAYAAKPLTPQQVHERILKRGIGNWVGVELQNGTAFAGRIVSADEESFGLQLHNDPAITPVRYSDVVNLHMGLSNGAFVGFMIAGIGGVAAMAAVGFYEVHKHSAMPALPAEPTGPAFP
jgi:hypothetical protein